MKTNNKLTLLAFTAMLSTQAIAANPAPIDSAILQLMSNGTIPANTGAARICGGMDDDQIVGGDGADFVKPSTTNFSFGASQGGALLTSVQYPYQIVAPGQNTASVCAAGTTACLYTSVQGPYQVQGTQPAGVAVGDVTGDGVRSSASSPQQPGLFTSVQYPYTLTALASGAPMIAGGLGNDTLVVGTGMGAGPVGVIVGGTGIDYIHAAGTPSFYTDSTGAFPLTSPMNGAPSFYTNSAGALPLASQANQIITGAGPGGAPHITGDAGDDLRTDRQLLQLMTTGSLHGDDDSDTIYGEGGADSLWGDNGTDSFVFGTTSY